MARTVAAKKPAAKKPAAKKPAAKKPATKAGFLELTASFVAPSNAYGETRVPKKLAASPRAATFLGLGYPHMLVPLDEDPVATPDWASFKKRYSDKRVIPRAILPALHAVCRSVITPEALTAAVTKPPKVKLEAAVEAALRYGGGNIVYIIENLFGAEETAAAFVAAIAKATSKDLAGGKYENYGGHVIEMLGWLLYRVPAKTRTQHRATLADVLARLQRDEKVWRAGDAIDVILNGRAGVERGGGRFGNQPTGFIHLSDLNFAGDDPAWLAERVAERFAVLRPADRSLFDIQLAVAGGPKVLALLRANTAAFKKDQAKDIADQLSLVA